MYRFSVKIAGIVIGITSLFAESRFFLRDYLTEEEPEFFIEIQRKNIEDLHNWVRENGGLHPVQERYLERLEIHRQLVEKLFPRDILLFHASAVAVDGEAYLFTAPSGTGKSTHTRLWREELPKLGHEVFMINDDKPLLRFTEEGIFVCGTPWSGKHELQTNAVVPLRGVCWLQRGEDNSICKLSPREVLPVLLEQSYRPSTTEGVMRKLAMLGRVFREAGVYKLCCNMEPSAASVSFGGMRGER